MHHIPGLINPADDETKALSWVLHSKHLGQAMGHYEVPNLKGIKLPPSQLMMQQNTEGSRDSSDMGRVLWHVVLGIVCYVLLGIGCYVINEKLKALPMYSQM